MKILFAASECVPFCKTGGLADVVGSLAPVLAKKGYDVRVIMPKYSMIPENYEAQMRHELDFEVQLGWRRQYCGIESIVMDSVTYYFVDNRYYFGRNYIYGLGGDEYERFAFYCRATLNALTLIPFVPDVIHAHDWQAGMIPALLRIQYAQVPEYSAIRTVLTIHNLQYQGIFGIKDVQDVLGLPSNVFTEDKIECFGSANYLKAGMVYADEITTVSPSYAEEIQTAYYGERLDGLLRAKRGHLTGILNGIDTEHYDPQTDPVIAQTYSAEDMGGKAACKRALQEELGLQERSAVPLIGMVGRLNNQKGLDLVDYVIADIMSEDVQLVCLGMGDTRYINLFSWAEQNYRGRVAARFVMDNELAHRVYAGADIFLMPSQFEPCGLSQMISMRYGTVPVVRETGGLRDTVLSYNEYSGMGNGFTFFNYNAHDMLHTIRRALHFYWNKKDVWTMLMHRGMTGDYSWDHSAEMYTSVYENMLRVLPDKKEPSQPLSVDRENQVAADGGIRRTMVRPELEEDRAEGEKAAGAAQTTEQVVAAKVPAEQAVKTPKTSVKKSGSKAPKAPKAPKALVKKPGGKASGARTPGASTANAAAELTLKGELKGQEKPAD